MNMICTTFCQKTSGHSDLKRVHCSRLKNGYSRFHREPNSTLIKILLFCSSGVTWMRRSGWPAPPRCVPILWWHCYGSAVSMTPEVWPCEMSNVTVKVRWCNYKKSTRGRCWL